MCFILVSFNECFVSSFVHDTKRDSQEDCLFAEYLFEKVYRTMMSLYFKQLEEHEVLGCPRLQGEHHIEAGQNEKQRI